MPVPICLAYRLASKISSAISDPAGFLEKELKLSAVDKLELCLVCEVCWRPQRDGAYEVTTKSDLCVKVRAPWSPRLRDPQLQKGAIALCDDACASGDADCKSNALHDQGGKRAGRHRTMLLARHRGRSERQRREL